MTVHTIVDDVNLGCVGFGEVGRCHGKDARRSAMRWFVPVAINDPQICLTRHLLGHLLQLGVRIRGGRECDQGEVRTGLRAEGNGRPASTADQAIGMHA